MHSPMKSSNDSQGRLSSPLGSALLKRKRVRQNNPLLEETPLSSPLGDALLKRKRSKREQHSSQRALEMTILDGAQSPVPLRRSSRTSRHIPTFPVAFRDAFFSPSPCLSCRGRPVRLIHESPNIYEIDNFLTEGELRHLDAFIEQQTNLKRGFLASYTDETSGKKILSEERTSTFFHIQKFADSKVRAVESRAAETLGLPASNAEPLQVVFYRQGQQFTEHHDSGTMGSDDEAVELVSPARLVTFFIYLNSLPAGQGATAFPRLNIKVRPERNKALVFSNVNSEGIPDPRVVHAALPVTGTYHKFGLNLWITDTDLSGLMLERSGCSLKCQKPVTKGAPEKDGRKKKP